VRPSYGCVLLTQGRRPHDLARALSSLLSQQDVDVDVVVVGNGWMPTGLPTKVRRVSLPHNVGIPAGRNAGVPAVSGALLSFLDDDASWADERALARVAELFAADPRLGLVQPRVVDPTGRPAPRRWVPRLRVGDPARSSDVCAVWEGALVMRRELFERIGGWGEDYFYAHEGVELAWRAWDAGLRVRYVGNVVVHHPVIDPNRHSFRHRLGARNRVWLARRNLPLPLAVAYVTTWAILGLRDVRTAADLRELVGGYREGVSAPCGPRRPMRWRTAWRMTLAGRPPVV